MSRRCLAALAALTLPLLSSLAAQAPDFYEPDRVREVRLRFAQPNYWALLTQNYQSGTEIEADMTVDGVTYPRVGARFRGNTSYRSLPAGHQKRSFNIRTDSFVAGQDLYGYSNLNLNNGFHDPTFMREFLIYTIARRYGIAPKCNFVKLYLNDEYWGIYINVQQPNKDMMGEWFDSNDGNRYRGFPTTGSPFGGRTSLTWLGNDVNQYLAAYQAKRGDGFDLMQVCNVLNNTPTSQLQAALPAVFNVDQFYRYAACMNLVVQVDSYIGTGKDHFMFVDQLDGAFHMFPFDVNEGFGAEGGSATLDPYINANSAQHPAISKTLQFPDWRARYTAHFRTILAESGSWQEIGSTIAHYQGLIAADVAADTKKIYTTQQFSQNVTQSVRGLGVFGRQVTIPGIQPLMTAREAFLNGLPELSTPQATLLNLQAVPAQPTANDAVTVTVDATSNAASLTLYSRRDAPFAGVPMFDDGQHGDGQAGDGTWGATLPAAPAGSVVHYYIGAETSSGVLRFLPKTAEHRSARYRVEWPVGSSPITINEFVARNVAGIVDQGGEHEDWLELYNQSSQQVDVGGMWLTDDLSRPKWQIPAGRMMAPLSTLLIWCDEDAMQGALHANFKLASGGEEIGLFTADGLTLLESRSFGPQQADIATGRLLDGGALWVTFAAPTPRATNQLAVCGQRSYSALDSTVHELDLAMAGLPQIGTAVTLQIDRGPASGTAFVAYGFAPGYTELADFGLGPAVLLLDPSTLVGPIAVALDGQGAGSEALSIPNETRLVGQALYAQTLTIGPGLVGASNAIEIVFCR